MPNHGTDGRQILKTATERIHRLAAEMRVLREQADFYPAEHRKASYQAKVAEVRSIQSQVLRDLAGWADLAAREARRKLAPTAAPDAGEELRIQRLIAGPTRGDDLAYQADLAYESGDLVNARILATAALAKSPGFDSGKLANETLRLVEFDEISADPRRSAGRRELEDLDVVLTVAQRDINSAMSQALRDGLELLKTTGGVDPQANKEMVGASLASKLAASEGAERFGGEYAEPAGALSGVPTGTVEPVGVTLAKTTLFPAEVG